MSQELDRINLYERRSISQCLETTFDFMRVNRRVWLRSTFVLIGPLALLLALLLTVVNMAAPEDHHAGLDYFLGWFEFDVPLLAASFGLGLWVVLVNVFTLVQLYEEYDGKIDRLLVADMWPHWLRCAGRTWWIAVLLTFFIILPFFSDSMFLGLAWLAVSVPLVLVPSVRLIGHAGVVNTLTKSVSLGFSAWFSLAFTVLLSLLVAFLVCTVLTFPLTILDVLSSTFSVDDATPWLLPTGLINFLFCTLAFFAFFALLSIVVLTTVYQYGNLVERVDAASVDRDVSNFENL